MPEREFEARSAVKERLTARAEQIAATGQSSPSLPRRSRGGLFENWKMPIYCPPRR